MVDPQTGRTPFLDLLDSDTRDRLMRASSRSHYGAGATVIKEGDLGRDIFLLLSGQCDVLIHGEVVNHMGPNELFGEIGALGGGTRTATVRAAQDVEILKISGDDLQGLMGCDPNVMTVLLKTLAQQTRRISDREMAVRDEQRELQAVERELLPDPEIFAPSERFSMEARWQPLTYASGDYCDVIDLGAGRYLIAVGDVMGHGAKTSLTLATVRGEFRSLAEQGLAPGEIIAQLDRHLARHGPRDIPITLVVCLLDERSLTARYSNAGHPQALLWRSGAVRAVSGVHGPLLGYGFVGDLEYPEGCVDLASGDRILFYTDGLSEARKGPDPSGDMLRSEGLADLFLDICRNRENEILLPLFVAVDGFRRGYPAHDDATALLVQVR